MKKLMVVFFLVSLVKVFGQNSISPESFLANPFARNDILVPNEEYNTYDALFSHLGRPINEFRANYPRINANGDSARGLNYRYYSLVAYFSKELNKVIIFEIKMDTKRFDYNGGFRIEDPRAKLENIFRGYITNSRKKDEILIRSNYIDIKLDFNGDNNLNGITITNYKYNNYIRADRE